MHQMMMILPSSRDVRDKVRNLNCTFDIVGGDFNITMEPPKDRSEPCWYNNNARKVIEEWKDSDNMIDIWRLRNPETRRFTWAKTKPKFSWSRIDYFIISANTVNIVTDSDILPCVLSDHSAIKLEIESCSNKRGPGSWKLNDKFLENEQFRENIVNLVKGITRAYSYENAINIWELIKTKATQYCRDFGKKEGEKDRKEKFDLYLLLNDIQQELVNEPTNNNFINNNA